MVKRIICCAFSASLLFTATAFAQSTPKEKDKTRWGVSVGFGPNWTVDERDKLGTLFFDDGGDSDSAHVNITGYEFRVGVARGRELGGDWEVSFVRRKIDDGSTVGEFVTECNDYFSPPNKTTHLCAATGTKNVYRGASLMGIEVNKFFAFVTIKKRVQVGLNLGIGVAQFHGVADRTERGVIYDGTKPPVVATPVTSVVDAKDLFVMKNVATGKITKFAPFAIGHCEPAFCFDQNSVL
jgi:opacity protein-like surface antigen